MIQYFPFFFLFGSWFDMAEKNISRTHFADCRSIKSLSWERLGGRSWKGCWRGHIAEEFLIGWSYLLGSFGFYKYKTGTLENFSAENQCCLFKNDFDVIPNQN